MIRNLILRNRIARATRMAHHYYLTAGNHIWSPIGDAAWDLYKHYRQKAARLTAQLR